jgi:chromosomal replication initiation ATPase DnaA
LYYTLSCLDATVNFLNQYIENGRITHQVPELVIDNLSRDKEELTNLITQYQALISKDPQTMALGDLQKILTDFENRKNKTVLIWERLKSSVLPADLNGCTLGLF